MAAVILSLLRYATYFKAIFKGTTKPHAFSWLGAAAMAGAAFVVQYQENAGPGLWPMGIVTLFCLIIGIVAIRQGEVEFTRSDWASLILMLLLLPVWLATGDALLALWLILVIELLNYYPTVRKSYSQPWHEDVFSWFISALRWTCAALAVSNITLPAILYPAFVAIFEFGFVIYLLIRCRMVSAKLTTSIKPR